MARKTPKSSSDYEVGYAKPPAHTRFRPGQSGNPKGRAKRTKGTRAIAREALDLLVPVLEKGIRRKKTAREIAFRKLAEKAVGGDIKALSFLLAAANEEADAGEDRAFTSEQDKRIIAAFLERHKVRTRGIP